MVDRPINVLFVSHRANLKGGGQRSLLTLVTALDRQQIRPIVMVPDQTGTLPDVLKEAGIPVITVHYRSWLSQPGLLLPAQIGVHLIANLRGYLGLRSSLRERDIDLVYSNTLFSPMGALAARVLRKPHIWHAREFVHEGLHRVYDWGTPVSMDFIDRTTARVICNSYALMSSLATHLPPEKCTVVYNGFPDLEDSQSDSEPPHLAPDRPVRLGMIGQLDENKGHSDAIRALRLLSEHHPEAELWIVGTGDKAYMARVQHLADELGVADRVVWKGFVDDMSTIWPLLDIVLVCSRAETFGRVAVEAMAHHRPVVASNVGGIPEIIEDHMNGLLYPAGDFQFLAAQVERLISDPALYAQIASEAAALVRQRFSLEQYVTSIIGIIRDVVSASQGETASE